MRCRILSLTALLALTACGASLWPTTTVKTKSYAPDLYGCAVASARALKYNLVSHDSTGGTFEARRKYSLRGEGPDVDEYDRADVLTVQIIQARRDTTGAATLKVQAGTLSTHGTKKGPTEEPEYASEAAKKDAQTIVSRCAST
jgi:hypothetical protein